MILQLVQFECDSSHKQVCTGEQFSYSGAGKTTLMNTLANQNISSLRISGTIKVNGQEIGNKMKSISAYVQQEDLFIGTLTVKEHIYFQVS